MKKYRLHLVLIINGCSNNYVEAFPVAVYTGNAWTQVLTGY